MKEVAEEEDRGVKETMISQIGQIFALPLISDVFTSKTITATFSDNGLPLTLDVKSTAAAEKAVSTFESVTDEDLNVRKKLMSSELDKTKAETELLKAQA